MISKYAKFVEIGDGVFAVYNSLVFRPVFVSRDELFNIVKEDVNDDIKKIMTELGVYVKDETRDDKAMNNVINFVENRKKKLNILYLIVSTACNLACKYCFIEENPNTVVCPAMMDKDTAKTAMDKFFNELEKESLPSKIIIYGGEPMTNKGLLEFIFGYAREKSPDTELTMISNATLIDDEMINIINKYQVGVGVSIDGPKHINDKNRVFAVGSESVYDKVVETVKKMRDASCPMCLSITITKDVLDNQDEIIEWIKSLGVKDVFWNLFHFTEKTDEWKEYYEKMSDFILRADDELEKYGIVDGRVSELTEYFKNNTLRFESCGAVGINQVAVSPGGECCICHGDNRDPRYNLGNINEKTIPEIFNSIGIKKWENKLPINHEECRNCEAFYVCGGGCPAHAEVLFGSRDEIDKSVCIFYKKYLLWVLRKYYNINKEE